jgi:hypothetical protein
VKELEIRITLKGKGQHRNKKMIRVASKENKGEIKKVLHPSNFL